MAPGLLGVALWPLILRPGFCIFSYHERLRGALYHTSLSRSATRETTLTFMFISNKSASIHLW